MFSLEPIIVIVGFLGAGKTTLLKYLTERYIEVGWRPYIILNDYENAFLDAQQLTEQSSPNWVKALNGSCICCSGITELRESVNRIPTRERGITLVEANGTSDACSLMGFLGVGLNDRFKPPVQISVVDARNWQRRDVDPINNAEEAQNNNELEANQIQVSSLIILNYREAISEERRAFVQDDVKRLNPYAQIVWREEFDYTMIPELVPSKNTARKLDHEKAHWASCSIDLPDLPETSCIEAICEALPPTILRVKGCTKIGDADQYTYFERCPDGAVAIRPFRGKPMTGAKLLTIGPGSDPKMLEEVVAQNRKMSD